MQLDSKDEATLLVMLSRIYCNMDFPFAVSVIADNGWALRTLRAEVFAAGISVRHNAGPDNLTVNITLNEYEQSLEHVSRSN